MRKYKTSKRGLTFSITPDEQYYPGSHYVYEVRRNCIIIRPYDFLCHLGISPCLFVLHSRKAAQ